MLAQRGRRWGSIWSKSGASLDVFHKRLLLKAFYGLKAVSHYTSERSVALRYKIIEIRVIRKYRIVKIQNCAYPYVCQRITSMICQRQQISAYDQRISRHMVSL